MTDQNSILCTLSTFSGLSAEILRQGKSLRFQAHGSSMAPLLRDGDILLVKPADPSAIRIGDIILCSMSSSCVVVHRVIQKRSTSKGISFLIQGDQKQESDGWVQEEKIFGQVVEINRSNQSLEMRNPVMRFLGILAVLRSRFGIGRKGLPFHIEQIIKKLPIFYRYLFQENSFDTK